MFNRHGEPTPRSRQKGAQAQQPETVSDSSSENETTPTEPPSAPANPPLRHPPLQKLKPMTWTEAMERMADYNLDDCPRCGARLAPIVVVLDPDEIQLALDQRGLVDSVPLLSRAPARGPPVGQLELPFPGRTSQRSDLLPSSRSLPEPGARSRSSAAAIPAEGAGVRPQGSTETQFRREPAPIPAGTARRE